jgi:hypothetical protein
MPSPPFSGEYLGCDYLTNTIKFLANPQDWINRRIRNMTKLRFRIDIIR